MGVPYSENVGWNKNMVKRVLENDKYLGTDIYPQLISEEVFRAVNERKSAKAISLCIVPDELQAVRSITVSCVKRITVSHSCIIEAEFINGMIIRNETERSDDNGDCI